MTGKQKIAIALASLVILAALLFIARRFRSNTAPVVSRDRLLAFGQILAEETVGAIHDHGRVVVIMDAPRYEDSYSQLGDEWRSFQAELKKHPAVNLTFEVLPVDLDHGAMGAGCSGDQLRQMLAKYAPADAIVFLLSLPEWGTLAPNPPQTVTPKILAGDSVVFGTQHQYGGYFKNNILSVLISQRPPGPIAAAAKTVRETFNSYYQITTPQNYQTLPE